MHTIMIVLHATAAVLCFAFGVMTLLPHVTNPSRQNLFRYYFAALIAMIVFLAGAILAHLRDLGGVQRGVFGALFVLSLYMLRRGYQAREALALRRDGWPAGYTDHIGFTLISLFEGFVIVLAISLGAPGWLTSAVAVLGVLVGVRVLHSVKTEATHAG